jgi:hypothetical protein
VSAESCDVADASAGVFHGLVAAESDDIVSVAGGFPTANVGRANYGSVREAPTRLLREVAEHATFIDW